MTTTLRACSSSKAVMNRPSATANSGKRVDIFRLHAAQEKSLHVRVPVSNFVRLIVEVDPIGEDSRVGDRRSWLLQ